MYERKAMNINAIGYKPWLEALQAAMKGHTGKALSGKHVKELNEELTEEWFRGTPPKQAATLILHRLFPDDANGAPPVAPAWAARNEMTTPQLTGEQQTNPPSELSSELITSTTKAA